MRLEIVTAKVDPKPESKIALITGDGRCLQADLDEFLKWGSPHDVFTIGRSINVYPGRVKNWVNVDGQQDGRWAFQLAPKNNGQMPIRHTMGDCPGYDVDWDIKDEVIYQKDEKVRWFGTSSLFAVHVCLALGYGKIVLAGCPMDTNGHWYFPEDTGPKWEGECFMAWMDFARTSEAKKVQSLSGYTRQILDGNGNI